MSINLHLFPSITLLYPTRLILRYYRPLAKQKQKQKQNPLLVLVALAKLALKKQGAGYIREWLNLRLTTVFCCLCSDKQDMLSAPPATFLF